MFRSGCPIAVSSLDVPISLVVELLSSTTVEPSLSKVISELLLLHSESVGETLVAEALVADERSNSPEEVDSVAVVDEVVKVLSVVWALDRDIVFQAKSICGK